jgi:hypothetical protein
VQTVTIHPLGGVQAWEAQGWFRSTTANKNVRIKLQWYNASNTLISESTRDMTPVAGVWVWAVLRASAPDTATGVRWAIGQTATPAAGDTLYIDECILLPDTADDGFRMAYGATAGTPILDWRAVGGKHYQYRAYAVAANGTDVYGPWSS